MKLKRGLVGLIGIGALLAVGFKDKNPELYVAQKSDVVIDAALENKLSTMGYSDYEINNMSKDRIDYFKGINIQQSISKTYIYDTKTKEGFPLEGTYTEEAVEDYVYGMKGVLRMTVTNVVDSTGTGECVVKTKFTVKQQDDSYNDVLSQTVPLFMYVKPYTDTDGTITLPIYSSYYYHCAWQGNGVGRYYRTDSWNYKDNKEMYKIDNYNRIVTTYFPCKQDTYGIDIKTLTQHSETFVDLIFTLEIRYYISSNTNDYEVRSMYTHQKTNTHGFDFSKLTVTKTEPYYTYNSGKFAWFGKTTTFGNTTSVAVTMHYDK